ncbi:ABC transporter ATP-binding protein [endosymbiont 'TC1' of Trimyema compressum]|uniref:ABC transporter ATP-binding protein n=1 Tax=endosymbiont 'TC1' of Trimyema compressum TaxID=243899 RepID=UPI00139231A0|nr:ABC transporter ATP-binding protein [endosymbiont 'TC1' of Trimyema compressum]
MVDIKVNAISKHFNKKTVLYNISCSFPKGKLTSILGPSGCGKTTLLNCITGFLEPDVGFICFNNQEVNKVLMNKRKAPMVHQDLLLFPHMNVQDNISFGLRMAKMKSADIRRKTDFLILRRMGLQSEAFKYPYTLSGGQKQRVALGRALAIEPSVLLLDEAFSKLDTNLRKDMGKFVKCVQEEFKITTILVTQPKTLSVAEFLGKENIFPVIIKEGNYYLTEGVFPCGSIREGFGHIMLNQKDIIISNEGISGEIVEILYCGNRGYKYIIKDFGENIVYYSYNLLPYTIGKTIYLSIDFSMQCFIKKGKSC